MNIDRLLLAEKMLREVHTKTWKVTSKAMLQAKDSDKDFGKKGVFCLDTWVNEPTLVPGAGKDCGFSACAVGHMCLDSRFNEQGLVMDLNWGREGGPEYVLEDGGSYNPHSWDAVQMFFDISHEQAIYLFHRDQYRDELIIRAKDVADRILELVNRYNQYAH